MTGKIVGHGKQALYYLDGKRVGRRAFRLAFPDRQAGTGQGLVGFKPLHSEALAVHPDQIQEAEADAKAKGVPVDFDRQGRPVFTSSRQFRSYARAYGFVHRGY